MRKTTTIVAAVGAGLLAMAAPAAHAAKGERVTGAWQQLVNCAITDYDPVTHRMSCIGSSHWDGTWTGLARYVVHGTYDPLTGDAEGTITESFRGHAADGSRGRLYFDERFTLLGATSQIHIDATMIGASGGFAGARGHATFDGTNNAATGNGTYAGWWRRRRAHEAGRP